MDWIKKPFLFVWAWLFLKNDGINGILVKWGVLILGVVLTLIGACVTGTVYPIISLFAFGVVNFVVSVGVFIYDFCDMCSEAIEKDDEEETTDFEGIADALWYRVTWFLVVLPLVVVMSVLSFY